MPRLAVKPTTQTRVSIWIDNKDLQDFCRLYPMHGAFTTFVRKALSSRLKKVTADMEDLIRE